MENIQQVLARINSVPIPRRVKPRWSTMTRPCFMLMFPILVMVLIRGDIISTVASYFGKDTQAEVMQTSTWITYGKRSESSHYGACISFQSGHGTLQTRVETGRKIYDGIFKGSKIGIKYLEWAPQYPAAGGGNPAVILLVLILFIIPIWAGIRPLHAHYLLAGKGTAVAGKVTGVKKGRFDQRTWSVSYSFRGKTFNDLFNGAGENPGELIVMVDPESVDNAEVYDRLYWEPVLKRT